MDTSAGLTPFKKQKRDKKQKENGVASAKKDKPTVQCTLDPDHVTSRVRPCNLSLRILPSKVASDTPFLGRLWTDLAKILLDFISRVRPNVYQVSAKSVNRLPR